MALVEQIAPQFTVEEAVGLAEAVYGLTVSARLLPSYLDQNFLLKEASGRAFVLKIANAAEDPAVLDLQQKALDYLAEHHPAPAFHRVRPTASGAGRATVEGKDGVRYQVWMVTYLQGRVMARVNPQMP